MSQSNLRNEGKSAINRDRSREISQLLRVTENFTSVKAYIPCSWMMDLNDRKTRNHPWPPVIGPPTQKIPQGERDADPN